MPFASSFRVPRGSGWQDIGAYVNLEAYYLVGVPVDLSSNALAGSIPPKIADFTNNDLFGLVLADLASFDNLNFDRNDKLCEKPLGSKSSSGEGKSYGFGNGGGFKGVARGSGWQDIGAYVNLGAYYLIGVPVALQSLLHYSNFNFQISKTGVFSVVFGGHRCCNPFSQMALVKLADINGWDLHLQNRNSRSGCESGVREAL
nr:protein detoxification 15 [Quercus suber]